MRTPQKPRTQSVLQFEALEPRVLFDAAPEASVVSGDTLIIDEAGVDEEISFNVILENMGDQTGHTPYVDFLASPDIAIQEDSNDDGVIDGFYPAVKLTGCEDIEIVEPNLTIDTIRSPSWPKR